MQITKDELNIIIAKATQEACKNFLDDEKISAGLKKHADPSSPNKISNEGLAVYTVQTCIAFTTQILRSVLSEIVCKD